MMVKSLIKVLTNMLLSVTIILISCIVLTACSSTESTSSELSSAEVDLTDIESEEDDDSTNCIYCDDSPEHTLLKTQNEFTGLIPLAYFKVSYPNGKNAFGTKFHDNLYERIMYDPETSVMYVAICEYSNFSIDIGFSVMYNADGTPKLYNPENQ